MSLGLRLRAKLAAPCVDPDELRHRVAEWLQTNYALMSPAVRHDVIESSPALFFQLHPTAEGIEISVIDSEHLVVSANTATVGSGYHIFVVSLLKDLARELNAIWDEPAKESEEFSDETDFFFTNDQDQLAENMTCWLQAVANTFFDGSFGADDKGIALCMPLNPHFESDEAAITPLGPRDRDWLRRTAQDGKNGTDFFAWWTPGLNAEYYLGRALTQTWSQVRWRAPVNDSEGRILREIADSLRKAHGPNPSLEYPWPEWSEILAFIDADPAERGFVHGHVQRQSSIGYRRCNISQTLPGAWRIRIPGSFSDFDDDGNGDLCALDPPREIWFTAYGFGNDNTSSIFESMKSEFKIAGPAISRSAKATSRTPRSRTNGPIPAKPISS